MCCSKCQYFLSIPFFGLHTDKLRFELEKVMVCISRSQHLLGGGEVGRGSDGRSCEVSIKLDNKLASISLTTYSF